MRKFLNYLLALALFSVACLVTACGKTGPLYLPDSQPQQPAQQEK
ncbi:MAG: hypothetical protein QG652_1066 [Pseudomonadota bacterium]|nr:hypothetical protein [Pseudomonadota bacterium]